MIQKDQLILDEDSLKLKESAYLSMMNVLLFISNMPEGRYKALALTKLEECNHWIEAAITNEQRKRTAHPLVAAE